MNMSATNVVLVMVSLALMLYLFVAMLWPERF